MGRRWNTMGMRGRVLTGVAGALVLGAVVTVAVLLAVGGAGNTRASTALGAVKATFHPDTTRLGDCASGTAHCLEQAFGNLAFHDGAKVALDQFDQATRTTPAVERDCHRIGHAIGAGALMRNRGDIGKTFAEGRPTCWSGYYHGILERAFAGVPANQLGKKAGTLCTSPQVRVTTYLHYQCVHGIGHGLMIYTSYDLPRALHVCEQIPDAWESQSCDGGVFMENISSVYGITSKYLRKDDPVYPCNAIAERHKQYCFLMVTSRINALDGNDWRATAATCAKVAASRWRAVCFQSFGRDASGQTRSDPARMRALCLLAGANQRDCVYGAARDVVSNDGNATRVRLFCAGLGTGELRTTCFAAAGTILNQLLPDPAALRAACTAAGGPAYAAACERGAAVRS